MLSTRRTPGGRRARGAPLTPRTAPYLLIAPFFVLFAIFGVFPLFYTGWVSLHDWDLISSGPHEFVGLGNYRTLADDPDFRNAIVNTLGIFVLATVPQILIALGLAALLNQTLRARTFFRMGVLLPNVTSIAAVSIVFSQLFGREYGLVNYVLSLGRHRPGQLAGAQVVVVDRDRDHGRLAVDGLQHADPARGDAGHPVGAVRRRQGGRRDRLPRLPQRDGADAALHAACSWSSSRPSAASSCSPSRCCSTPRRPRPTAAPAASSRRSRCTSTRPPSAASTSGTRPRSPGCCSSSCC